MTHDRDRHPGKSEAAAIFRRLGARLTENSDTGACVVGEHLLTPAETAICRRVANLLRVCVREEETEPQWAAATHPDQRVEHSRYGSIVTTGSGVGCTMAPAFFDGLLTAARLLDLYADRNSMPAHRDQVTTDEAYRSLQNITGEDPAAWRPVILPPASDQQGAG